MGSRGSERENLRMRGTGRDVEVQGYCGGGKLSGKSRTRRDNERTRGMVGVEEVEGKASR